MKSGDSYAHLVEIDEENRRLVIHRIDNDGKKVLYTHIPMPEPICLNDKKKLAEFTQLIGENLLIDSPAARRLLKL